MLRQFIIAVAGIVDVHPDDGRSRKTIHLRRANQRLLLLSMIWIGQPVLPEQAGHLVASVRAVLEKTS